ncbi:hypothetical protein JHK86_006310 [Glycine max]|nr:hypothetical protein JHK86_006310 [Glycine max]
MSHWLTLESLICFFSASSSTAPTTLRVLFKFSSKLRSSFFPRMKSTTSSADSLSNTTSRKAERNAPPTASAMMSRTKERNWLQ